jgi:hypothetical protein
MASSFAGALTVFATGVCAASRSSAAFSLAGRLHAAINQGSVEMVHLPAFSHRLWKACPDLIISGLCF